MKRIFAGFLMIIAIVSLAQAQKFNGLDLNMGNLSGRRMQKRALLVLKILMEKKEKAAWQPQAQAQGPHANSVRSGK